MSVMKKSRKDEIDMVNCLMLLSKVGQPADSPAAKTDKWRSDRLFTCKTCNRGFATFQALGGHRASHKKPKITPGMGADLLLAQLPASAKPKAHECPICGVEFAIGQALGGHMRRHRDALQAAAADQSRSATPPQPQPTPVLKKSNSSKRVTCANMELDLDLGLAPPGHHKYDLAKLQLIS